MKFELSTKAKWLLFVGAPLAIAISIWIGSSDEIDRLAHMAKKGNLETKLYAISELASYGSGATDAIDNLRGLLMSGESQVRQAAGQALIQIDHRAAVNAFTYAMRSADSGVRMDAREGLEQIGSKRAQVAVSTLSDQSEKRYQRSRIKSGWFKKMKKSFKREKEQKYKHHRRIYRD